MGVVEKAIRAHECVPWRRVAALEVIAEANAFKLARLGTTVTDVSAAP